MMVAGRSVRRYDGAGYHAMSDLTPPPPRAAAGAARPRRRPFGWLRRILLAVAAVGVVGAAGVAAGFWWFIWSVPTHEVALDRNADGIVVLTGGSSRIADAMHLLSAGYGKRLLITGVHHATTSAAISRLIPDYRTLVSCCVDLDYSAVNTEGNAIETKRWAQRRGVRSLIVVTSNYHMPRARAELARQLPDVVLIEFPVVSDKVRTDQWWSPLTARLLLSEYLKYIVVQMRMRLEPGLASSSAADEPQLATR
jgi:uncharacterized SAM-binding protein YcdF (DUF218 family)